MPRAIIFDVDGTLVDSVDLHAEAWREAFLKFGKEVPVTQIRQQIGKGGDQLLPVFWTEGELHELEKPLSEYRSKIFRENFMARVKPFPKVRELLEHLLEQGKQLALASSAAPEELAQYKKIARIDDLVNTETSKADAEKSKPYPDIFQAALARLGKDFAPEECVIVGDTPYDIEAARRARVATVAVRCGGFPEKSLRGAVKIYDDPAALLAHVEEWANQDITRTAG